MREIEGNQRVISRLLYGVSHDLGAPLRHVSEFSRLLTKSAADRLSEKELQWLGFIHSAGAESQRMIQGLLQVSRVYQAPLILEPVSLEALLTDVWQGLEHQLPDMHRGSLKSARYSLDHDATLTIDRQRMRLCLQEILRNAVIFRVDDEPIEIRINVTMTAEGFVLRVIDNGLGVRTDQLEHMTTPFKRLLPDRHPEGLGLGLFIAEICTMQMNMAMDICESGDSGLAVQIRSAPETREANIKPAT